MIADGKSAELAAAYELMRMADPDVVRWADYWGMRFYRMTGVWPRFKSAPMELNPKRDEDGKLFEQWMSEERQLVYRNAIKEFGLPPEQRDQKE